MFIKIAVRDLSPGMVAWSRIALAAIVLVGIAAARGTFGRVGLGRTLTLTLMAAVQVAGPFFLISAGETEISSSLAGILVTSTPLFTALLAIWVDHEERSQGVRLAGDAWGDRGRRPTRGRPGRLGKRAPRGASRSSSPGSATRSAP